MATAPVKPPQQLHNFPLSLKWGQTTTSTSSSANLHDDVSDHRTAGLPLSFTVSTSQHQQQQTPHFPPPPPPPSPPPLPRVGSRSARLQRVSFASCSSILPKHQRSQSPEMDSGVSQKPPEKETKTDDEEGNARPWKLRPRRGGSSARNGGDLVASAMMQMSEQRDREVVAPEKSTRLRPEGGCGGGGGSEKKEKKRKFSIALSREEIEEDVFALTGSRPARRPRKRPKNVQRLLDAVFPGLWLVGATPESWRMAEAAVKR